MRTCRSLKTKSWQPWDFDNNQWILIVAIQFQTFGNLSHTLMRTCRSLKTKSWQPWVFDNNQWILIVAIQFQTFGNLIHTLMRTCRSFKTKSWQPWDFDNNQWILIVAIQFQTFGNLIHTLMRTCRSLLQEKLYKTKQNQKLWKNQKKKKRDTCWLWEPPHLLPIATKFHSRTISLWRKVVCLFCFSHWDLSKPWCLLLHS
jgi:membrane-bound metal-dependent hydrolase YbcI (DUF457 family)